MSQKDKVKELVGRGLSSYHTKALQQIERIEKKNKEQNHKISILTGELDKDYITKTAEGSVISLDHSKEGMVYLDELQGNTLVNYCTDGSKEMALNGDIDVEGTFVTTTEGIDNGKVDVMCEGNTLVNLYKSSIPRFSRSDVVNNNTNTYNITTNNNYIKVVGENLQTSNYRYIYFDIAKLAMLKPNTKYTIIFKKCKVPSLTKCTIQRGDSLSNISNNVSLPNGSDRLVLTTKDTVTVDSQGLYIWNFVNDTSLDIEIELTGIIEGDYTNEEIPSKYFEGMKSVGQDDENTHKIEILSHNGNLYKRLENSHYKVYGSTVTIIEENENGFIYKAEEWDMGLSYLISTEGLFKNKKYRLSWERNNNTPNTPLLHSDGIKLLDSNKSFKEIISWDDFDYLEHDFKLPDSFEQGDILEIRFKNGALSVENGACNICINEIGVAKNTVISKLNKKEISLNEPLRALPNRVCDKVVKINNKYFIERNCGYIFLDNTKNWTYNTSHVNPIFECSIKDNVVLTADITGDKMLCDKLESKAIYSTNENYGICFVNGSVCRIRINGFTTSEEYINWIRNNPLSVVYQLPTPIYEPLEIEPVLNTYNDVTHISNNSIIPCNMKIQNTGYNAIIKPNTLYTVAVDTNKGGTIGMNLGGAKATTTNNVAKITTPATLADDSLRLYGKGIKGSKVRLLEGDKTNWIPSHFEGMKSSFEDKVQEDNSYKMEISSNNKNLINIKDYNKNAWGINISYSQGQIVLNGTLTEKDDGLSDYYLVGSWDTAEDNLNLKPNTRYTFSGNMPNGVEAYIIHKAKVLCGINSDNKIATWTNGSIRDVNALMVRVREGYTFSNTKINIQIEESSTSTAFTNNIYNKIQFSSIEPLRSTKDISDRFIFKDGKIMIERNCIERDLTYFKFSTTEIKGLNLKGGIPISDAYRQPQGGANTKIKCDKLASDFKEDIIPCINIYHHANQNELRVSIPQRLLKTIDKNGINDYFANNPHKVIYRLAEPYYEEIPHELQKIILEGYENGTLFLDTNIPPTVTVTYAGETPIARATKINKTEVLNNTEDINDNIIPYLMDMDYRVVMLQLATEELEGGVSMARLFGGTYEMIKRDILSKRLTREEYGHRLADYFNAGKLTEEQVRELEELR